MSDHGNALRVLEQSGGVGVNPGLLRLLPREFQFNLGLTGGVPLHLASANVRSAIGQLSGADQRMLLEALGFSSPKSGPPMSFGVDPSASWVQKRLALRRSSGAFKRLAQVIIGGPENPFVQSFNRTPTDTVSPTLMASRLAA